MKWRIMTRSDDNVYMLFSSSVSFCDIGKDLDAIEAL